MFKFNRYYLGLFLSIVTALAFYRYLLYPGYFDIHDDLQVTRQHQMRRCFLDGQLPCRWSPDLGAGRGFPMFNFYSPLPNYSGMPLVWLGLSYMTVTKLLFLISVLGAAVGIYLLSWKLASNWLAALVASILYTTAPYHLLDILVRGAMAESWALMWFPWILLAIYRWVYVAKPSLLPNPFIALTIAGLYLSHNIMSLWFTPIIFAWTLMLTTKKLLKKEYHFWSFVSCQLSFVTSYLWALGLSAFFLLPALTEKNLVHTQNLIRDYFDYHLHFASWSQLLIDRTWGFGASREGSVDGISFQVGWPHWWIVVLSLFVIISCLIAQKLKVKSFVYCQMSNVLLTGFFVFLFFGSLFMTHSKSVLVWEALPLLAWTQFPWRVLAITIFTSSLVGGLLLQYFRPRLQIIFASLIIAPTIILNWNYTTPSGYNSQASDADKLSGSTWDQQRRGALLDYLPLSVKTFDVYLPTEPVTLLPLDPQKSAVFASYREWHQRTDFFSFDVEVFGEESVNVVVAVFDFPNWQVYMDDHLVDHHRDNDLGSIAFTVPPGGKRHITAWFRDPPIRTLANTLSVASYLLLVYYFFRPFVSLPSSIKPQPARKSKTKPKI